MKFLIDECAGRSIAQWLQAQGHDVVAIVDAAPSISDDQVLHKALIENRILVTMDKDFGDLVFRNKQNHCGVILMRLIDSQISRKIAVLSKVLAQHEHELDYNFVVATEQSIRIIRMGTWH